MKIKGIAYVLLVTLAISCRENVTINKTNNNVLPADFLSGQQFTLLTIEVVYVNGYQPTLASINGLKSFLQGILNKPSGITVLQTAIASPAKTTLSVDDLRTIETAHRMQKTGGSSLTAWIYFGDADFAGNSGNSKVLGLSYGASSMAVFEKTVKEFVGGVGEPSAEVLETTVLSHEFGHVVGLTNNGTPMLTSHQDTANGRHCITQSCLMYYNVETSDMVSNLTGGSVPQLDAACAADLKANGGK